MSTSNHEPNETAAPAAPGGWEPIPQSEGYDEGATAFVHLPPEFMLDGVPLEAPGHGYTPPMIVPLQPLAQPPAEGVELLPEQPFEPLPHGYGEEAAGGPAARPYAEHDPHATAEWHFGQAGQWPAPEESAEAPAYGTQTFGAPDFGTQTFEVPDFGARGFGERGPAPQGAGERDPGAQDFGTGTSRAPDSGPQDLGTPVGESAGAGGEVPVEAPLDAAPDAASGTVHDAVPDVPLGASPDAAEPVSYEQAPPTLPGGAPAPWAVPGAAGEPAAGEPERAPEPEPGAGAGPEAGPEPDAGAAALEAVAEEPGDAPDAPVPSYTSVDSDEHPHTSYVLRVNGADRPVTDSWIGESLLYVLRERLGLAGAKDGCSQGECGACNVQVDGRLVASCLVPAATAAGSEVRTVEGLATDGEPSDVQKALARCGTVQCGFCVPGMCMTVHDLLEGNHAPTPLEARQALAGNLCRCSGYKGVLQAVEEVVAERAATAADHAAVGEEDASAPIPHQHQHQHDGGRA
ncbi:2Fe-2S iron-sulfur cluster-binding protein [Streptomyces griseus]|uniref:2Fe-2S iron-sulfur cluster-binding protein n=1 Tax=Streptomyces griseus TaxID=1911 RepID=UPI0004C9EFAE|nr:(2Fe-2S)-binding protein [Streptomyces griseus]